MTRKQKEYFMKSSIEYAKECFTHGDVPVGAVIVKDGQIISKGKNTRERDQNAAAHAELTAISKACQTLGTRRLEGTSIFVTLEPCPMCAGAILLARISHIYIGAMDFNTGACGSKINLFDFSMGPIPTIEYGILKEQCKSLLSDFFENLRT